jgi:hypothetical protein
VPPVRDADVQPQHETDEVNLRRDGDRRLRQGSERHEAGEARFHQSRVRPIHDPGLRPRSQ